VGGRLVNDKYRIESNKEVQILALVGLMGSLDHSTSLRNFGVITFLNVNFRC